MNDTEEATQLTYTLTWSDYRQFNVYVQLHGTKYRWLGKIGLYALSLFVIGMWLYVVYMIKITLGGTKTPIPWSMSSGLLLNLLETACIPVALVWTDWVAPLLRFRRQYGAFKSRSFVAAPDYAEAISDGVSARYRWSKFTKVVVARGLVMLFTTPSDSVVIPVSVFDPPAVAGTFASLAEGRRVADLAAVDDMWSHAQRDSWPPAPHSIRAPFRETTLEESTTTNVCAAVEIFEPAARFVGESYVSLRVTTIVALIVASIAFYGYGHDLNAIPAAAVAGAGIWVIFWVVTDSVTRSTIAKAVKNPAARCQLHYSDGAVTIQSLSFAVSSSAQSLWSVHRTLDHAVVFTDPFTAFVVANTEFGGLTEAKRFVERMRTGIAVAKGKRM